MTNPYPPAQPLNTSGFKVETPYPKVKQYACDGCTVHYWLTEEQVDSIDTKDWCPCGSFRGWCLVGGKAYNLLMNGGSPWELFIAGPATRMYTKYVTGQMEEHFRE